MEEFILNRATAIAKQILDILLYQSDMIMSWGVDPESIKSIMVDNSPGLQFHVLGYKHSGYVQILLEDSASTFEIKLLTDDDEVLSTTHLVTPEKLVSVADELVEKTEDYENRVSSDYQNLINRANSGNPISVISL